MKTQPHGRELFGGTARIFAAEALLVPVGVVTAAFLSRRFGAEGYGLLTLATVLVVWIEANVAAALSRPAIKLVGDAATDDWRAVGTALLRLYLLVGLALMLLIWATAAPLAALFNEPALSNYLRLLALDVPIFCFAQAHRGILVGMGRFRERAVTTAARWVARFVLVVAFVLVSGTLAAALWGIIGASLVELVVCRLYVRPSLLRRDSYPVRELCVYALPLVASALCVSLYHRLDLLLLKALGGTAAEAGVYGVAQNLSLLPSLFAFSLAPALLSTMTRALRDGDDAAARHVARQAMRAVILLSPAAAITAGAAPEIVGLIFGAEFLRAAPLLSLLIFGALALLMMSVTTCVMVAAGKPVWTLHVAWPLLLGAGVAHLLLIPRFGAISAAAVTTGFACAGALVTIGLASRLFGRVAPPAPTLWRSAIVCLLAYATTAVFPASGLMLLLKLAGVSLLALIVYTLLGEFSANEIGAARATLFRRRRAGLGLGATGDAS